MTCQTYWGSHGCHLPPGHRHGHVCCCHSYVRHVFHRLFRAGCVGRAPYYGRGTRFY